MRHVSAATLCALLGAALTARPGAVAHAAVTAGAEGLRQAYAAHQAVYALSLKASTDQDVVAARGTMTYDLTDACTGWSTSQHLTINLTDRDGRDLKMVSDYATFESKDGTRLTFHSRQLTDDTVTESLDGAATLDRSGGSGHADYASPARRQIHLPPGTMLPEAHTRTIISGAREGKHFLSIPLFDGTTADGAEDSFVSLGAMQPPGGSRWPALSPLPSVKVHVAFFGRDQKSEMPDYEVGMRYFTNGVADDLVMNFGDFTMQGKLDQLLVRPDARC
jgi:hypothetical protein